MAYLRNILEYIQVSAEIGPFLLIGTVLLAGATGGWVAKSLRLPVITGNILGGVLIGPSCLKVVNGAAELHTLQPLAMFAMGLITVSIGGHLSYRRIHNALKRILAISLLEVAGTVTLVTFVARCFRASWATALLLGVISAATAPATIVALIRENRGKGSFVKTLLSVVAVDNILCILLFVMVRILISNYHQKAGVFPRLDLAVFHSFVQLIGSIFVGLCIGKITEKLVSNHRFHNFSMVFVAILFSTGLSSYLGLSPLLTNLFFGVYLGNSSHAAEEQLDVLGPIEPLLYVCFFTLAGASLHLDHLLRVGALCLAYLVARFAGKAVGAVLGGILTGSSRRIWENIPLALVPQAGVAIALVVLIEGDPNIPEEIAAAVGAVVLAAVVINEIVGPFLTRNALICAKEANKDRARLMDFIHEEFIVTDLKALDKWDAIRQLTNFLIRTHRVEHIMRHELYASIVEREKGISTALGKGVAIPHGRISKGPAIQGVLGICRDGVEFDAPDGKPVHIIVLIVTPENHEDKHLQVLASLAEMVSDEIIYTRLTAAINANDAWEVIEGEETRNYNYFLEEDASE